MSQILFFQKKQDFIYNIIVVVINKNDFVLSNYLSKRQRDFT